MSAAIFNKGDLCHQRTLSLCAMTIKNPLASCTKFNLSMSRSDIGNYLGIAEETVCRMFTRFQNEGLLATERQQVQLHDLDRLSNIARG